MCPGSFSFIVYADNHNSIEGMISMNYLVFLNPQAGELEKILSGVKSMILKEFHPARTADLSICVGDSLYFLKDYGEPNLRVKANVVRVLAINNNHDNDLARTLKELQPKLQLTEAQYNDWSVKKQVLMVEFESARKIDMIQVALNKITKGGDWIAFDEFSYIT
jgi:hypothetical protein